MRNGKLGNQKARIQKTLVRSRTKRFDNLTLTESRRAAALTKRLTCFRSFTELLGFYRDISFRDFNCRKAAPGLMASWSEDDREQEEIEHKLLLELARLVELAQGAKRKITVDLRLAKAS